MTRIITFILLLACNFAFGQNEITEIKETFTSYRSFIEQKDYDHAFDYYHPELLKYISKDELKQLITFTINPDKVQYTVNDSKVLFISEVVTKNDKKYAFIKYSAYYNFYLNSNLDSIEVERIKKIYKDRDGDNYSYIESEKKIVIYKEQELIGIKEDTWKFVLYKKKLHDYMILWIPKDVFDELLKKRAGKNMLKKG